MMMKVKNGDDNLIPLEEYEPVCSQCYCEGYYFCWETGEHNYLIPMLPSCRMAICVQCCLNGALARDKSRGGDLIFHCNNCIKKKHVIPAYIVDYCAQSAGNLIIFEKLFVEINFSFCHVEYMLEELLKFESIEYNQHLYK